MVLVVVVPTAFWAFAFTSIYTNTQTRVAASEWIYANIPQGTHVLNEHWDDAIPLNLPDMPGSGAYVRAIRSPCTTTTIQKSSPR